MNSRIITTILLLILIMPTLSAQSKSQKIKPQWLTMRNMHSNNIKYDFIVTEGMGETLAAAKQGTFVNLTTKIETERGIVVTSTIDATSTMNRSSGKTEYDSNRVFNIQYKESGKLIKVTAKVIDEYWTYNGGTYTCYILYSVANGSYDAILSDDIQVKASYGANGLWRSAIIPGWGQFYKGSKLKGGLMLGGTAALAIGAVVAEGQRADYTSKVSQTNNADHMRTYLNNANNMETMRNICIGGAAAIYIYNLIDAIVAPGAKRVIVKSRSNFINNTVVVPVASSQMSGVSATYNF